MALPKKSTVFKNIKRDEDPRGSILSIVDEPVNNVSIITNLFNLLAKLFTSLNKFLDSRHVCIKLNPVGSHKKGYT